MARLGSLFLLPLLFIGVWSYPNSVPATTSVCRHMTPGHGPAALNSQVPYEVLTSHSSVKGGEKVEIKLRSKSDPNEKSEVFKGFYIQGRDKDSKPVGTFMNSKDVKAHNCFGKKGNGAHHTNPENKDEIVLFWNAPKDFNGPVVFTTTFVKDFDNFWIQVKAIPVAVSNEVRK